MSGTGPRARRSRAGRVLTVMAAAAARERMAAFFDAL